MCVAQKMRIKLIDVSALLPADIALPGVALAVAALVQEVKCLVREPDPAEDALQVLQVEHMSLQVLPCLVI